MWGHFEVSVSNVTKILILEKIDLLIVICGHVWIFELVQWFWLAWGYNAQGVTTKDTRHTACLFVMHVTNLPNFDTRQNCDIKVSLTILRAKKIWCPSP